jgi:hypothetical protein
MRDMYLMEDEPMTPTSYDEAEGRKIFAGYVREAAKAAEAAGHVANLETCKQIALVTTMRNGLRVLGEIKRLGLINDDEYEASRRKYIFCVVMLGAAKDDIATTDTAEEHTLHPKPST